MIIKDGNIIFRILYNIDFDEKHFLRKMDK